MIATNWKESADFWRERSNAFELALRKIAAFNTGHPITTSEGRWEIAFEALKASKKDSEEQS